MYGSAQFRKCCVGKNLQENAMVKKKYIYLLIIVICKKKYKEIKIFMYRDLPRITFILKSFLCRIS